MLILSLLVPSCDQDQRNSLSEKGFWWKINNKGCENKYIDCKRHYAMNVETEAITLPKDRVRDASVFKVIIIYITGTIFLRDRTWNKKL